MLDIESLYKEYFSTVYKYLYSLSHDKEVSEELTYVAKIFRNNFEETQEMLYKTIKDLEEAGYQLVTIVEDDGTIRKDIVPINEIDN